MLYLDIGNSSLKLKDFNDGKWDEILRADVKDAARIVTVLKQYKGETILVASVRGDISQYLSEKSKQVNLHFIRISDFRNGMINYKTPETLGVDRLLACYGARSLAGGEAVTVVDAGSACTVDIMDQNGVFHGGVIMPGLTMLESSLKHYAPELPLPERKIPESWPAKSTNEAIQWGVTGLFVQSVRWIVERYRDQFGDLQVWVTGGDGTIIKRYLGGAVTIHADLVFEGMRSYHETQQYVKRDVPGGM